MKKISKNAQSLYRFLLEIYPQSYRKRFGAEMETVFEDLYQESNGGFLFWSKIARDTVSSGIVQHLEYFKRNGLNNYSKNMLHISFWNIVSFLLLIPIGSIFLLDMTSLFIMHSHALLQPLTKSFLYQKPVGGMIFLVFPALALIINLIPLVLDFPIGKTRIFSLQYGKQHIASLFLLAIATGFFVLIVGHDMIPCTLTHVFQLGPARIFYIYRFCRLTY